MKAQFLPDKSVFEEHLGQDFVLALSESDRVPVRLISVESLRTTRQPGQRAEARESFSLVFCAPENRYLRQGIYRIEHPKSGELESFLVPIGPDPQGRGMRMEAIYDFAL